MSFLAPVLEGTIVEGGAAGGAAAGAAGGAGRLGSFFGAAGRMMPFGGGGGSQQPQGPSQQDNLRAVSASTDRMLHQH